MTRRNVQNHAKQSLRKKELSFNKYLRLFGAIPGTVDTCNNTCTVLLRVTSSPHFFFSFFLSERLKHMKLEAYVNDLYVVDAEQKETEQKRRTRRACAAKS